MKPLFPLYLIVFTLLIGVSAPSHGAFDNFPMTYSQDSTLIDSTCPSGIYIFVYGDVDNDGYGSPTIYLEICQDDLPIFLGMNSPGNNVWVTTPDDCNDHDPALHIAGSPCTMDDGWDGTVMYLDSTECECVSNWSCAGGINIGDMCLTDDGVDGYYDVVNDSCLCIPDTTINSPVCAVGDTCIDQFGDTGTYQLVNGACICSVDAPLFPCSVNALMRIYGDVDNDGVGSQTIYLDICPDDLPIYLAMNTPNNNVWVTTGGDCDDHDPNKGAVGDACTTDDGDPGTLQVVNGTCECQANATPAPCSSNTLMRIYGDVDNDGVGSQTIYLDICPDDLQTYLDMNTPNNNVWVTTGGDCDDNDPNKGAVGNACTTDDGDPGTLQIVNGSCVCQANATPAPCTTNTLMRIYGDVDNDGIGSQTIYLDICPDDLQTYLDMNTPNNNVWVTTGGDCDDHDPNKGAVGDACTTDDGDPGTLQIVNGSCDCVANPPGGNNCPNEGEPCDWDNDGIDMDGKIDENCNCESIYECPIKKTRPGKVCREGAIANGIISEDCECINTMDCDDWNLNVGDQCWQGGVLGVLNDDCECNTDQ